MPTSKREQCCTAVLTALQTIAGVTVARDRADDITVDECPALILISGGHGTTDRHTGETNYTLEIIVEAWAAASTDDGLGPALNDLYAQTAQVLFDLVAPFEDVREVGMDDPIVVREGREQPVVAAVLRFVGDFSTAEGDPYS